MINRLKLKLQQIIYINNENYSNKTERYQWQNNLYQKVKQCFVTEHLTNVGLHYPKDIWDFN
jgi:hypothetical protein